MLEMLKIPQFEDFSRWAQTPGPQSVQTSPLLPQCLLLMFLFGRPRCRQRWDQALQLCSPGSWSPGVLAEGLTSAELVQGNILVSKQKPFLSFLKIVEKGRQGSVRAMIKTSPDALMLTPKQLRWASDLPTKKAWALKETSGNHPQFLFETVLVLDRGNALIYLVWISQTISK